MTFMKSLLKKETKKLFRAFKNPTFIYLTIVGNGILLGAVTLVYFLERNINPNMKTYFDYIWWGVSTITTVAYGDILPITFAGRVIAIFLMYTGTVLFITFTGVILTMLTKEEVERELNPIEKEFKQNERDQVQIQKTLNKILERLEHLEKGSKKSDQDHIL